MPATPLLKFSTMNRVLLVNDSDEVLDRTATMLDDLGWEVYVAGTEQAAFESIVASRPTMVICDIEMDGGAGLECIATARTLFADLFIVAVTRGADREDWTEAAQTKGADRYVVGPVSARQLADLIDDAVAAGHIDDRPCPPGGRAP